MLWLKLKQKKEPAEIGKEFLDNMFATVSLEAEVEIMSEKTNSKQVYLNIKSPDLGIIIGHRGETLDAFQYLTSLVINKNHNRYIRVMLDAEGYRKKKKANFNKIGQ